MGRAVQVDWTSSRDGAARTRRLRRTSQWIAVGAVLGLGFASGAFGAGAAVAQSGDPIIADPADLTPAVATEEWSRDEFVWPLSGTAIPDAPLISPFGPRLHANQGFAYDFHRGIDIQAPSGTPIFAIHDGWVAAAGVTQGFTDQIIELVIEREDHPTLHVVHTHVSGVAVAVGEPVVQGQLLGWTGMSMSGLEHLHFEIRRGARLQRHAVNPVTYLPLPESDAHELAVAAVTASGLDEGQSDVVVSVRMPFAELDFEGLSLELHHELDLFAEGPADAVPPVDLSPWSFDLGPLNAVQTPFVDGASDLTALDDPVVVLSDDGLARVRISPARFDGRNPPWDRAAYEFTFLSVPLGDLSAGPWYLAAVMRDVAGAEAMAWHVPPGDVGGPQCNGEPATVVMAFGHQPTPQRDVILGTPGDDVIAGGDGDDVICGLDGNDRIWGQSGNDTIFGAGGDDHLRGSIGDDVVHGGDGADDLNGGSGDDLVFGDDGDDSAVRGGTGDDLVDAGAGADLLVAGNGGSDQVLGGPGADKVTGGPRPDIVRGGDGDDELKGRKGADQLFGDAGNDSLRGGPQPDALDGGDGVDECNGGTTPPPAEGPRALERDTVVDCETVVSVP